MKERAAKRREALTERILEYMQRFGTHNMTLTKIQDYISKSGPAIERPPSGVMISKLLHKKFNMRYGRLNPAVLRYRDPDFDEKRIWVCRLIAQFIYEGALVVSIDEANFRADSLPV